MNIYVNGTRCKMLDIEDIRFEVPIKLALKIAVKAVGSSEKMARKLNVSQSLVAKWIEEVPSGDNPDLSGARTDAERIVLMMLEAYNSNPESGERAAYLILKYFQDAYDAIQADRQGKWIEKLKSFSDVKKTGWEAFVKMCEEPTGK
jgi:hypothetical protein